MTRLTGRRCRTDRPPPLAAVQPARHRQRPARRACRAQARRSFGRIPSRRQDSDVLS
jgi:hypothetical protein